MTKKFFLLVALFGAACAICFARALGGLFADVASQRTPDPSLSAPPPSKAKLIREISERRERQKKELEEIMR